jgi:hypothetical protein
VWRISYSETPIERAAEAALRQSSHAIPTGAASDTFATLRVFQSRALALSQTDVLISIDRSKRNPEL